MLFNSFDFAVFLPIVFLLYHGLGSRRRQAQNVLLLIASYIFYGWWDWRFLSLIFISTLVDYGVGLALDSTSEVSRRKLFLALSLTANLGILGFFKYFNFFADNAAAMFHAFGLTLNTGTLHIILPVGISFYTFQTLSYSIDVYRGKLAARRDFPAFAAFVAFFPQLVAGPIERASNLLPQFETERRFSFDKAVDGLRQMLWGFFKKLVIADNCAEYADRIFSHSAGADGSTLLLGLIFFAFQIYGDFSGYSDIAIGTARLFGFSLMRNFANPYFSRDIAEFWRRWHISLSTWFRDYVYIPLGGSRGGRLQTLRNTVIVFAVSGFWHGASWTFVIWGLLNALYFLPLQIGGRNRNHLNVVAAGRHLPDLAEIRDMALTFSLTLIAWTFFRAHSAMDAVLYLRGLFSLSLFSYPSLPGIGKSFMTLLLILFFVIVEWIGREEHYALAILKYVPSRWARWFAYAGLIFMIGVFMQTIETPFIYFQF